MRQSNDTRKPVSNSGPERDTTAFENFERNVRHPDY